MLLWLYLIVSSLFEFIVASDILQYGSYQALSFIKSITPEKSLPLAYDYLFLTFLGIVVAARLSLAFNMKNRGLFVLVALIHIIEAIGFIVPTLVSPASNVRYGEGFFEEKSLKDNAILFVIGFQAL